MTDERIPHPLIHEDVVTFPGAKPGMQQARLKLLAKERVVVALNEDPTMNDMKRKAELSKWASQDLAGGITSLEYGGQAIDRRTLALNVEISQSRKPPPISDCQEIRRALRSMEPAKRRQIIDQAIAEGDGQTIGAVLSASPWLVGEDGNYTKMIEARWTSTHFADHAQELRSLSEDRKRVDLAIQAFEKILAEAEAPGREALAATRRTKTVLETAP